MRWRLRLMRCALLGGIAWSTTSHAQTSLVPTDAELASAYCISVLERQLGMLDERTLQYSQASAYTAPQLEQYRHDLVENLQRLQAYLLPKATLLDTTSLSGASARAEADVDEVIHSGTRTLAACERSDPHDALGCTFQKVRSTGAWRRTERCAHIDFLPF